MEKISSAVFIKDGKFLLEKRKEDEDNYSGVWCFPGGHIESGESAKEAVVREMKEELDVFIISCEEILSCEDVDPTSGKNYRHHFFLVNKYMGEISESSEQGEIRWFVKSEIPLDLAVVKEVLTVLP